MILAERVFSQATDELVMTSYLDDKQSVYFKNKDFEADYKWLESQASRHGTRVGSRTRDEQTWVVSANSDTEPGVTYIFDRKAHKLAKQFTVAKSCRVKSLAKMKPVNYKSSDGLEIPAYLTLPKGVPGKEPAHRDLPARRAVGARFLGL